MEFANDDEDSVLLGAAARFGADRLRENERAFEKAGSYPTELVAEYEELGFAALRLDEGHGGSDMSRGIAAAVWSALAEADPAAPLGLDRLGPAARDVLEADGGLAEQSGAFEVARDLSIGAKGVSGIVPFVPRAKVDWLALATRDGLFLLREPPAHATERACGLQACSGVTVVLDQTPFEQVGGPEVARRSIDEARIFAGALMLGAARDAHAAATEYALERIAFGKPIAHHQGLAFQLADAATELQAAELLFGAALSREDRPELLANAHAFVGEVALRVAERSVQVLGGHGYLYDHRVEKRMRDIRSIASLWGGATDSETFAAENVLEFPDALEAST